MRWKLQRVSVHVVSNRTHQLGGVKYSPFHALTASDYDTKIVNMSASSELTANCYLMAVKELLKQRGITYGQLADTLECSLPTIKRLLNKPTLPLSRLLEIAEIANIEFSEISERADQLRPQHYVFSDSQDALFAERPEMLVYLQELMVGKTPDEIATHHDLNPRSTAEYQKQLERVGLIKRKSGSPPKLLVSPPVGFGPGSRVLKKEMEEFLNSVIGTVVYGKESRSDCFAIIKPMTLTEQGYAALLDGLKRLVDQYSAIGESRLLAPEARPWQIAIACGPGPKPKQNSLPRIR